MKIKDVHSHDELKDMGIGWYRRVAELDIESLSENEIVYTAGTPFTGRYHGYQNNTYRAYIWNGKAVCLLFKNTNYARALKALRHYGQYLSGEIPSWVWDNYVTNGYHTRRGLFADYSKSKARMKDIARSHADHLGSETGSSAIDHLMRVNMRN